MSTSPSLSTLRPWIIKIAALLVFVQVLFPPKVFHGGSAFGATSEKLGYVFLFSDPRAAQNKMMKELSETGMNLFDAKTKTSIDWGQLIIQLAVTGAISFAAIKFADAKGGGA